MLQMAASEGDSCTTHTGQFCNAVVEDLAPMIRMRKHSGVLSQLVPITTGSHHSTVAWSSVRDRLLWSHAGWGQHARGDHNLGVCSLPEGKYPGLLHLPTV